MKKDRLKEFGKGGAAMLLVGGLAAALAAAGAPAEGGLLASGAMAMMGGTLAPAPAAKTFAEAMKDPQLKLSDKEQALLQRLTKEMKLDRRPPVTGLVNEMNDVIAAATAPRGDSTSVMLVGKAGVGKTAVMEKLAQAIAVSDGQPAGSTYKLETMEGRYLLEVDVARLLDQDEPVKALDAVIEVLSKFNDESMKTGNKVMLFVDELHQIYEHPKGKQLVNMLLRPLRNGNVTIIGATNDVKYKEHFDKDEMFKRRMPPIWISEATALQTLRALKGAKGYYEDLNDAVITPEALASAANDTRFDQEIHLPGRAFEYLKRALRKAGFKFQRDRLRNEIDDASGDLVYAVEQLSEELGNKDLVTEGLKTEEPSVIELYNEAVDLTKKLVSLYAQRAAVPTSGKPVVTADDVKRQVSHQTKVAVGQLALGNEPLEKYRDMEKILGETVKGQPEPIAAISNAVRQNKMGLSPGDKPMGVFYLTGPTGTGKTHLAKELARFLFDDPEAMIRVDMTEYMESHTVAQFKGSPPGYVGHDKGGQLAEKVRRRPHSVVLFDEIEKAHPDVWLLLLQILGEGRLTDGQGRFVDFRNTLVLMTSNLGMHAVDVGPWAAQFADIQKQQRAAAAAGDEKTAASLAAQKRRIADELAVITKQRTEEVTAKAFKDVYPPEFQGRLSAPPIVFNRLTPEHAREVARINLDKLKSVLAYAGHEIDWTPAVVDHIVNEGYSVALGARPIQNAIDRFVTQPIAGELLDHAIANGNRLKPSRIDVAMERGAVRLTVTDAPPKPVERRQPEAGAVEHVFSRVLTSALKLASGQADAALSLGTLDGWFREALGAAAIASPAAEPAARPAAYEGPALASPTTYESAHLDFEAKDKSLRAGAKTLALALDEAGYGEAARELATRSVEDQADPFVGFLEVFTEQAKRAAPSREGTLGVSYELGAEKAAVVVRRPGRLGGRERSLLDAHFGGAAPADAAAARDMAEALNVMGRDGRRLMFDLHRKIAATPGARLGWREADGAVEYWLELARPAALASEAPAVIAQQSQPAPQPDPPAEQPAAAAPSERGKVKRGAHHHLGQRRIKLTLSSSIGGLGAVKAWLQDNGLVFREAFPVFGKFIVVASIAEELEPAEAVQRLARSDLVREIEAAPVLYDRLPAEFPPPPAPPEQAAAEPAAPAPRAEPVSAPAAGAAGHPAKASARLREQARALAEAMIAQGDARSPSVLLAAGELLAAVSTPADVERARLWLASPLHDQGYAQVAAAAQMLARHGSRADDQARLLEAMTRAETGNYNADLYKPVKRRLAQALAALLATDNRRRVAELMRLLADEEAKPSKHSAAPPEQPRQNLLVEDAYYAALSRHAGSEALEFMLEHWQPRHAEALVAYLKRVDEPRLRALYEAWKTAASPPAGMDRALMLLAVAEYGRADDAPKLYDQVRTGWQNALDSQGVARAADALARLVARTDAFDSVAGRVRDGLRANLMTPFTFNPMIVALKVAGAAGGAEQLEAIEAVMRANVGTINPSHEMSQHDAATAWARIVHRLGWVDRLMTVAQAAPVDQATLPKLQQMLVDQSPIVNKAALAALRLRLTEAAPARRDEPEVPERMLDKQPLLRDGPAPVAHLSWSATYGRLDDASLEDARFHLAGVDPAERALVGELFALLRPALRALLDVPFEPEARVYMEGGSAPTIVWALRQSFGAAPGPGAAAAAAETLAGLVHAASLPPERRAAALAVDTRSLGPVEPLLEVFAELLRRSAAAGLEGAALPPSFDAETDDAADSSGAELWLTFPKAPPTPANGPSRAELTPEQEHGFMRRTTWRPRP